MATATRLQAFLIASAVALGAAAQGTPAGTSAEVVSFRHTLRWLDEARFPAYFLEPEARATLFDELGADLRARFGVSEVRFPDRVDYRFIWAFGKADHRFPAGPSAANLRVVVSSFITRATTGFAVNWSMYVVVKQGGKTVLESEVKHELENASPAGYFTSEPWLTAQELTETCNQLIREALALTPPLPATIVLDSLEKKEAQASAGLEQPVRHLLKTHGKWLNVAALAPVSKSDRLIFSVKLVGESAAPLQATYKDGWDSTTVESNLGRELLAALFNEVTGLPGVYTQRVRHEKKGMLTYSDGSKTRLRLRWLEELHVTTSGGVVAANFRDPQVGELYRADELTAYFFSHRYRQVLATPDTQIVALGTAIENTLGWGITYRVDGVWKGREFIAVYDDRKGIVEITCDRRPLAAMLVWNCNPENRSFGDATLSKNKHVMYQKSPHLGKPSLEDESEIEWYPVFIAEHGGEDRFEAVLEILVCTFFAIAHM